MKECYDIRLNDDGSLFFMIKGRYIALGRLEKDHYWFIDFFNHTGNILYFIDDIEATALILGSDNGYNEKTARTIATTLNKLVKEYFKHECRRHYRNL